MDTNAAQRADPAREVADGVRVIGHRDLGNGIRRERGELAYGDQGHGFIVARSECAETGKAG